MRPSSSPHDLERRRVRAVTLLKQGLAPVEVARRLGVDRRSVRRWRASYERGGATALAAKRAPGRPPRLDHRDKRILAHTLAQGARAVGWYSTDLWTRSRVREVLEYRFDIKYHADHIGRLLRSMGWRYQKPERNKVAIGWVKGESKR